MYNQSITKRNLEKCLNQKDFRGCTSFTDVDLRKEQMINSALEFYKTNNVIPETVCTNFKRKKIYKIKDSGHVLLQRKIAHAFSTIFSVKIINRDITIKRIRELLKDDSPYRVYRLDIKSFYESVDLDDVFKDFSKGHIFTKKNLSTAKSLLQINGAYLGLPRGYALSSVLSEVILKSFDNFLFNQGNIIFYARFVDDILLITNASEDAAQFIEEIKTHLPYGLSLNNSKQKIISFDKNCDGNFSYLGYLFEVKKYADRKERPVNLEISPSKVKKIKSRIVLAFLDYSQKLTKIQTSTPVALRPALIRVEIALLKDRIRFLSGNYEFMDYKFDCERSAGLYFNYRLIEEGERKSLKELDAFLLGILRGGKNKVFRQVRGHLRSLSVPLADEFKKIIELSFYENFTKVTYFYFNEKRLEEIQKCWKYVA